MNEGHAPKYISVPAPVRKIYEAVAELEKLYRQRKFTPDGHLVGSIGEVIAAEAFNLELLPMSARVHDARDKQNRMVQIKLTAGSRISMYDCCERLIVLRLVSHDKAKAEVVYDGPGQPVWKAAGREQKNGQKSVSISAIKRIAKTIVPSV